MKFPKHLLGLTPVCVSVLQLHLQWRHQWRKLKKLLVQSGCLLLTTKQQRRPNPAQPIKAHQTQHSHRPSFSSLLSSSSPLPQFNFLGFVVRCNVISPNFILPNPTSSGALLISLEFSLSLIHLPHKIQPRILTFSLLDPSTTCLVLIQQFDAGCGSLRVGHRNGANAENLSVFLGWVAELNEGVNVGWWCQCPIYIV